MSAEVHPEPNPSTDETPTSAESSPPAESPEMSQKAKDIAAKLRGGRSAGKAPAPAATAKAKPIEDGLAKHARSIRIEKTVEMLPSDKVPVPSKRKGVVNPEVEEELDAVFSDVSLEDVLDAAPIAKGSEELLEVDSRFRATVTKIHRDDVFFTIDGINEGFASLRQFSDPPAEGTVMDVIVRGFNRDDGLYELSVPGASVAVSDWADLAEGAVVEAKVTAANSGGLECTVSNIRGFIPASQVAMYRVEDFEDYVDKKLLCIVTELNPQRGNLVLSHRAVLEREREEKRAETLQNLQVGETYEGIVRSIRDFGAFVDLGGVDGLIHISQLSWERVNHPSDVLEEGQRVKVKVDKIDPQTGKIGLSYRDLLDHPWTNAEQQYPVNSVVKGTVSRIANFGAFVRLDSGIEGLVHISELAHHRVTRVSTVVQEGQDVEVRVLSVDAENQKMALSMKQAGQAAEANADEEEVEEPLRESAVAKHVGPLKGGVNKPSGGEQFGLKW